jgi:hypothetical protein
MPGVGVALELVQVADESGAKGIQVDVTDELAELALDPANDRVVPILKKGTESLMAPIEAGYKACEKRAHRMLERALAHPDEEMKMVGHERPGIDLELVLGDDLRKAAQQFFAISIVVKDRLSVDPARDEVVDRSSRIESWSARHNPSMSPGRALEGGELYVSIPRSPRSAQISCLDGDGMAHDPAWARYRVCAGAAGA